MEVEKFIKLHTPKSTNGGITEARYLVLELAKAIQADIDANILKSEQHD